MSPTSELNYLKTSSTLRNWKAASPVCLCSLLYCQSSRAPLVAAGIKRSGSRSSVPTYQQPLHSDGGGGVPRFKFSRRCRHRRGNVLPPDKKAPNADRKERAAAGCICWLAALRKDAEHSSFSGDAAGRGGGVEGGGGGFSAEMGIALKASEKVRPHHRRKSGKGLTTAKDAQKQPSVIQL